MKPFGRQFGRRIDLMAALPDDWDDCGSPPPNQTARYAAKCFLARCEVSGVTPYAVQPATTGGVSVVFETAGRVVHVQMSNRGGCCAVRYTRPATTKPVTLRVDHSVPGYGQLIDWIRTATEVPSETATDAGAGAGAAGLHAAAVCPDGDPVVAVDAVGGVRLSHPPVTGLIVFSHAVTAP